MPRKNPLLVASLSLAFLALIVLPFLMPSDYWKQLLIQAIIYSVIVVGYNFVTGDIGQLSMAQQGFFAIGAYTTALLSTSAAWPWWACLLSSVVFTGLVGAIVGIPTLRVRGQYLIMVTMAFSEIVRLLATNFGELTGGASGVMKIPYPSLFGWSFESKNSIYFLYLGIAAVMILIAYRVRSTKYGRAFLAIRDGELAADVMGLNTTYVKVVAFGLSAVFAGVGGSMFASSFNYISPDTFTLSQTVLILVMLLIGGEGSIAGAVVGAVVLTYLPEFLRFTRSYYIFIYGVMIVLITLFLPGGIVGWVKKYWYGQLAPRLFKVAPADAAKAVSKFDAMDLFAKNLPLGQLKETAGPKARGKPEEKPDNGRPTP